MVGEDDDEPTAVVGGRRRKKDPLKVTAHDLKQLLELLPADDDQTQSTPKVHDLGAMLRQMQGERLEALQKRKLKRTLKSGATLVAARASVANADKPPPRRQRAETSRWPWLLAMLISGAVLLILGFWFARTVHRPNQVRISWELDPSDTSVSIGGIAQPNRGSGTFACDDGVPVQLSAPGRASEVLHLACGAQVVLRFELPKKE